ncbi:MAG: ABC transporter ATP-binding protein/permease [Moraxella sp.]|nr:ABC transporter ATP-binding protein/permease [Moraxella sp.]
MDWSKQLIESALWIAKSLSITAVVFVLAMWLIIRFTHWGRQFWSMASGYLTPKRSMKPIAFFVFIVTLTLLEVRISLVHSEWYNTMYSSLQDLNQEVFWTQMVVFCAIATCAVANSLLTYYAEQRFSINWIEWLNKHLVDKWLAHQAYYKTQQVFGELDNPDQRIQQDVQTYVKQSLKFATGVISAVTSIVSFTILLWGLAGAMNVMGVQIPKMMVFLVFIYVLIATVIAMWLGRPLIRLNFDNEKFNANYRYSLIRVKEYAESIAFYAGEKVEKNRLYQEFRSVIDNMWAIVYRTLKFSGFNLVVSQVSVVFPLIIQVGRYFSGQIKLGDLMQTMQVFNRLHGNLSYFRNVYDDFAGYKATLNRLTSFDKAVSSTRLANPITIDHHDTDVIFTDLTIKTPADTVLIDKLNLTLPQGSRLLIKGKSGLGKTTLLRAVAGLWSHADGGIARPSDALFLSQKPYLPQGRLIDALYYPDVVPNPVADDEMMALLQKVQLGHLTDKLYQEHDWTHILSLGEQQRLAMARILLHRPSVVFLDEATASMDEGLEDALYRLLLSQLPATTLISVGHRSTLLQYHDHILHILPDKQWQLSKN